MFKESLFLEIELFLFVTVHRFQLPFIVLRKKKKGGENRKSNDRPIKPSILRSESYISSFSFPWSLDPVEKRILNGVFGGSGTLSNNLINRAHSWSRVAAFRVRANIDFRQAKSLCGGLRRSLKIVLSGPPSRDRQSLPPLS